MLRSLAHKLSGYRLTIDSISPFCTHIQGFLIFCGFLLVFFLIFVIVFAVVTEAPQTICGGSVVVLDISATKTVSIVYRLTVAVLCVVLGVGFLVYGVRFLEF